MAPIEFLQDFLAVNSIWLSQRLNRIKMSSNESKKIEYTMQTNIFDLPIFAWTLEYLKYIFFKKARGYKLGNVNNKNWIKEFIESLIWME